MRTQAVPYHLGFTCKEYAEYKDSKVHCRFCQAALSPFHPPFDPPPKRQEEEFNFIVIQLNEKEEVQQQHVRGGFVPLRVDLGGGQMERPRRRMRNMWSRMKVR